jgi:hypothetical protein
LAAHLIPRQSQTIVRVVWCTAAKTDDAAKLLRYRALARALEAVGVTRLGGHFILEPQCYRASEAASEVMDAIIDDETAYIEELIGISFVALQTKVRRASRIEGF